MMNDNSDRPNDILEVLVTAPSAQALSKLVETYAIDTGCMCRTSAPEAESVVGMLPRHVFDSMSADLRQRAQRGDASAPSVEIRENRSANAHVRRALVGRGNRYAQRAAVPQGLGVKE